MKKIICVMLIGILVMLGCFAAGVSDNSQDQSYSLLMTQKRLKNYKDSPDTAAFYECYVMRTDDIENDNCTLGLLDVFEKKGNLLQNIIGKPSIFINPTTSKRMVATSGASHLKEKNKVYKCIVLYSHQLLGTAVINLIEAKPVTDRVLMVWPTQENESLLSFNNYRNGKSSNALLVCYEKNVGKVVVIDQWPAPTTFKEYSIRDLQKERKETIMPSQLSEKDIQMFIDSMVDFGTFKTPNRRFVSITVYNENGNEIYSKDIFGTEIWHEYEYDKNGNIVHYKDTSGEEYWYEYDKNGNKTHYKNTSGYEYWFEYDKNGNIVHYKDTSGEEEWYEYDKNGNKIYFKDIFGYEYWCEYDKNGNMIHCKSKGKVKKYGVIWAESEYWYEYDKNGNKIYSKNTSGEEEWYEYDKNGNKTHYKNTSGYEYWFEYDKNGNETHYKNTEGDEEWYEYDKNGNKIYFKSKDDKREWYEEEWYEYDKNGNMIHSKVKSKRGEKWYEYEFWDNGKIKKMYTYANQR